MIENQSDSICEQNTFKKIYNTHVESMYHHFYYKFGKQEWAEDCVQDAFIKLWERCGDVSIPKAKSFLYTVANNLLINKHHHEKVKLRYQKEQVFTDGVDKDPLYLLEEKELKEHLLKTIEKLKPKQRSVFLLNRINGKTYVEIAEIEGISVKAVEKRMSLALIELRKVIENI